jgi:hypothetical protein
MRSAVVALARVEVAPRELAMTLANGFVPRDEAAHSAVT